MGTATSRRQPGEIRSGGKGRRRGGTRWREDHCRRGGGRQLARRPGGVVDKWSGLGGMPGSKGTRIGGGGSPSIGS